MIRGNDWLVKVTVRQIRLVIPSVKVGKYREILKAMPIGQEFTVEDVIERLERENHYQYSLTKNEAFKRLQILSKTPFIIHERRQERDVFTVNKDIMKVIKGMEKI